MVQKSLNRGMRPSGRVMLVFMLAMFLILFVATGVSFALIAHTGTMSGVNLLERASHDRLASRNIQSRRGTIFDRHGGIIASQHPSHTLYANHVADWGTVIEDVEYTSARLAEIIDMTAEEIFYILSLDLYQPLFGTAGQRLSFAQKYAIEALELPGLYFLPDLTRFYPNGAFAAHTVGYTWFTPEGAIKGAMGIEGYFNEELTAIDGLVHFQQDRFAILQPGQEVHYIIDPVDGFDIYLTLDPTIQNYLESAMDEVFYEAELNHVVAVIMDARTGEVLAIGSRPTFDPNDRDPTSYRNRVINHYEPGSTFKIFTYASAINEGNYNGSQTFMSGSRQVENITLRDHPGIGARERTFDEGFFVSTNTSIIDLLRFGVSHERFLEYLVDFGFGSRTGFPLYGESAGMLPNPDHPINIYTSGYGQGIDVTPIQMLQAVSAIVNDGEMIRPQLIARIYDPNTNEIVHRFEREVVSNPITAATARQMRELMKGVIHSQVGTGRINYILDVESGGKTGTAQISAGREGLMQGVHIYNYIGFAPFENPEIIMFIAVESEDGNGHHHGGEIYRAVMNNTLNFLGLTGNLVVASEQADSEFERIKTPRIFNLTTEDAINRIEQLGLTPIVIGNGAVVFNQLPAENTIIASDGKVFIQTAVNDSLPDFTGWTRAEIIFYERLLELNITIEGHGLGASQSISAGRQVSSGDSLTIVLE